MANLKDVAERAGVAVMTASKVLGGSTRVRHYLRERVLTAAAELGYTPNLIARAMRSQTSHIVSVAVVDLKNPFYAYLSQELSQRIRSAGFEPVLCNSIDKAEELNRTLATHAAILVTPGRAEKVNRMALSKRLVTIGSLRPERQEFPDVSIDFGPAYDELVRVALAAGRRRFAYYCAAGDYPFLPENRKVTQIRRTLRTANLKLLIPPQERAVSPATFADFVKKSPTIDSVFCENDYLAVSLSHELAMRGVKIPGQVLLAGCDDILFPFTGLWTVKIDLPAVAAAAVGIIRDWDKKDGGESVALTAAAVMRDNPKPAIKRNEMSRCKLAESTGRGSDC